MAFRPGAHYVTFNTITCTGSTDTVSNVYVTNADMTTSTKAVGIKLYPGGFGSVVVKNVTFDGVE